MRLCGTYFCLEVQLVQSCNKFVLRFVDLQMHKPVTVAHTCSAITVCILAHHW